MISLQISCCCCHRSLPTHESKSRKSQAWRSVTATFSFCHTLHLSVFSSAQRVTNTKQSEIHTDGTCRCQNLFDPTPREAPQNSSPLHQETQPLQQVKMVPSKQNQCNNLSVLFLSLNMTRALYASFLTKEEVQDPILVRSGHQRRMDVADVP